MFVCVRVYAHITLLVTALVYSSSITPLVVERSSPSRLSRRFLRPSSSVFSFALVWDGISPMVGLVVAVSLPLVSLWANLLGGLFPLLAVWMGYNPAVTSAPLMTTVVDSSGLVIYFLTARAIMPKFASAAAAGAGDGTIS